jgi:hypothetical protein
MNLAWFSAPATAEAENLIENSTTIAASYVLGDESIAYEEIWVTNQGDENGESTLVDFGFYIEGNDLTYFNRLLNYSSFTEAGKPCGLFIVYGYTDDTGETSYIDSFLTGELSSEDMLKFQLNWTQGVSPLTSIKMSQAFTYDNNSEYNQKANLQTKGGILNSNGENKGVLRIAVILRLPRIGTEKALSFVSQIRLNAHALKEIYET